MDFSPAPAWVIAASGCTTTTTSTAFSLPRDRRKTSLSNLLNRFRTTAEPTFRLIAQPRRAWPPANVSRAITVKQRVRTRTPSRWIRRNSRLLRTRAARGKRPPGSNAHTDSADDDIRDTATSCTPTPRDVCARGGVEPLELCDHWPSAYVYENHVFAFALGWKAERCASLVRPPSGWFFRHESTRTVNTDHAGPWLRLFEDPGYRAPLLEALYPTAHAAGVDPIEPSRLSGGSLEGERR